MLDCNLLFCCSYFNSNCEEIEDDMHEMIVFEKILRKMTDFDTECPLYI